jgi:hypothetical protein
MMRGQVEQETVTAEEFALMLLEYNVQMVPYQVYPNESKVKDLPYYPEDMPAYAPSINIRPQQALKKGLQSKVDSALSSSRLLGSSGKSS